MIQVRGFPQRWRDWVRSPARDRSHRTLLYDKQAVAMGILGSFMEEACTPRLFASNHQSRRCLPLRGGRPDITDVGVTTTGRVSCVGVDKGLGGRPHVRVGPHLGDVGSAKTCTPPVDLGILGPPMTVRRRLRENLCKRLSRRLANGRRGPVTTAPRRELGLAPTGSSHSSGNRPASERRLLLR